MNPPEIAPGTPAADESAATALTDVLPARFGLGTATFVVVASMVGVGVLTTSGYTVNSVGSNQLMLVLWVVGGLAALSAALTLAELSAALPRAGGEYVILFEAYGPLAAFLSGWVSFVLGSAAPIAASASASAAYLLVPMQLPEPMNWLSQQLLASVAIFLFAAIHISGQTHTARVQVTITIVKLAILVVFVLAGLAVGWPRYANLVDMPHVDLKVGTAMTFSLVYIAYAYFGWNAAAYIAGEVTDPARILPRSILLGTAGVVLLYLGLNTVYALALPAAEIQELASRDTNLVKPIAELTAKRLFGPGWAMPLSIATGLMLLSSLSAYILTGPRIAYAMARAGQFPAFAGRLSPRFQTPAIATAILAAIAIGMLWTGKFEVIVTYASVGMAIFSILTISAVYVLRWRRPAMARPFRTPGYPFVPAVYIITSLALTVAAFKMQPAVAGISVASILAGVPLYYLWTYFKHKTAAAEVAAKLEDIDSIA